MTDTATTPAPAASNDAFASMFSGSNGAAPDAPAAPAASDPVLPAAMDHPVPGTPAELPQERQPGQDDGTQPQSRMVPLAVLHAEREKRKAAEDASTAALARLTEQIERQNQIAEQQAATARANEEARLRALRNQQAQEAAQSIPDPNTDPAGYAQYVAWKAQYDQVNMAANFSERIARMQYGDDTVEKATQWALQRGAAQKYIGARDPYAALVSDYNAEQVLKQYGSDPTAVERAVMSRYGIDYDALQRQRQQPAQAAQVPAVSPAPAAQKPSVPPSLASVGQGGNPEAAVLDPMAHFNAIMGPHNGRPRG